MVVKTNTGLALRDTVVAESLDQVDTLINDDVMKDVGVLLILDLEVVGRELGDGKVGGTDGALM